MNWSDFIQVNIIFSILILAFGLLLSFNQSFKAKRWILYLIVLFSFLSLEMTKPFSSGSGNRLDTEVVHPEWDKEGAKFDAPGTTTKQKKEFTATHFWLDIATTLYFLGLGIFMLRYTYRLSQLIRFISFSEKEKYQEKYWAIKTNTQLSPFSFFNFLVLGKNNSADDAQILLHEKIHAEQWHSLDMILSEGIKIIFWFNPFSYWYVRLVKNNLEFLVDQKILASGADRTQYQYQLLKMGTQKNTFDFTNHYNHSFLKKRIIMMNSKQKLRKDYFQITLFLGLFLPLIQIFGQPSTESSQNIFTIISTETTKAELAKLQDDLFQRNIQLIFEELSFTEEGLLDVMKIKVLDSKGQLGYSLNRTKMEGLGLIPFGCVNLYFTESKGMGSRGLTAEIIDDLLQNWNNWEILGAGVNTTKNAIKQLRGKIAEVSEENKKRRAASPFTETYSKGRTTYRLSPDGIQHAKNKLKKLQEEKGLTPIYLIDGMEKSKTLDDFRLEEVNKLEFVTEFRRYKEGDEIKVEPVQLYVQITRKLNNQ